MSIKIIRKRERIEETHHSLQFDWPGERNWGFAYDCDKDGNVDESTMTPEGRANLAACRAGMVDGQPIGPGFVSEWTSRYILPAVGQCHCGQEVPLTDPLDNQCEGCGRWFNMSGQEVIPSHLCDEQGEPLPREEY